jgi:hypothetical protein
MAWHRVVPQHWCAPVSVGGTRCTFRAPSRGWRGPKNCVFFILQTLTWLVDIVHEEPPVDLAGRESRPARR